jgi:hypothetical protein
MYLNPTSLDNKLDELKVVVDMHYPSIIGVSETWFRRSTSCNIENYKIYRRDRSDGRGGGGVCLYIENSINSHELKDAVFDMSKIEQVWAVVYFGYDKYLVGCIYRPDYMNDMNDLEMVFKQARKHVDEKGFKDVLIMGDFNFGKIHWSNGSITSIKSESGSEYKFSEIVSDTFLYQHVNVPTFQKANGEVENILDLIFTTEAGSVCAVDPSFLLGDIIQGHLVIFFSFIIENRQPETYISPTVYKFLYNKANFNEISQLISNVDWVKLFENMTVQEMYDELIYYTSKASNLYIPTVDILNLKRKTEPWIIT